MELRAFVIMKRFNPINWWNGLPENVRHDIMQNYPWMIILMIVLALAGYFCVCCCPKASGAQIISPEEEAYKSAKARAEKKYLDRAKVNEQNKNYGVDLDKLSSKTRYLFNGKEVSREVALAAVSAPSLPDESRKLRLTIIGNEQDRKRVLDDLERHPALLKWKDQLVVFATGPDNPVLATTRLVTSGSPSITIQAPDGKVLARNKDGSYPGPEVLSDAIARAAKPYSPDKDPYLKPQGISDWLSSMLKSLSLDKVPPIAWVLGGLALLLYFRKDGAK